MLYKVGPRAVLYPAWVWLIILLLLFFTEYGVMLALPIFLPGETPSMEEAIVDALTVTAVIAPVIWWTLVRPLQKIIQLRTRFLGDLFNAIEAERRQTAHELHDGIGQHLSLLISGLRSAQEEIKDPEESGRLSHLHKLAQTSLDEVKRIARGLRPSLLDDLGLIPAIEKVVRDFNAHSSIKIQLRASLQEGIRLPEVVETTVFRILQEALTNVIRHSGAYNANIEVKDENEQIRLTIADDGRGCDPKRITEIGDGNHMGLVGIRERVALLGGLFSLETAPGQGFRIDVIIPSVGNIHGKNAHYAGG